jgi:bacteriocin-like protein
MFGSRFLVSESPIYQWRDIYAMNVQKNSSKRPQPVLSEAVPVQPLTEKEMSSVSGGILLYTY